MQVYKAFFKVINKNLSQILIYLFVFLFFSIMLASTYENRTNIDFTETKVNIVFINRDKNSILIKGLKEYLGSNVNIVDVPDDTQKLQDALFFREVEYIIKVPKGFTEGFLKGEEVRFEKTTVPNSISSIYLDNIINKYLNIAKMYTSNFKGLSEEDLISYIEKDMGEKAEVKVNNSYSQSINEERTSYYFNYLSYSIFAILILGVCSVMLVFNDPDLKKRNLSSPVKLTNINIQMILGNISFAILAWLIMILASFILYGSYMFTFRGLLLLLNSFIFTLAALSISFLIGNIIKSRGAMSALANVVSLGSCFISGVFVPQALLGKTVLKIASFTPTYWYVKGNNIIVKLVDYKIVNLTQIITSMLIILGFAIAILTVTLVIIKQKRLSS